MKRAIFVFLIYNETFMRMNGTRKVMYESEDNKDNGKRAQKEYDSFQLIFPDILSACARLSENYSTEKFIIKIRVMRVIKDFAGI